MGPGNPAGAEANNRATQLVPKIEAEMVTVDASGNASINIFFVSAGQSITAIQFDIAYEHNFRALSVIAGPTVNNTEKSIWQSNSQEGVVRIVIAGMNRAPFTDGLLAALPVQVKSGTPPGVYKLLIGNIVAANDGGYPVPLSGGNGGIIVPGDGILAPVILRVANAASYVSDAVSPGEIVVIGGNWLGQKALNTLQFTSSGQVSTSLADTRVLFDGIPAPLLYTTQEQLSAIVPYAVDGRSQTSLQVEYLGVRSAPVVLPVTATVPAIFTLDQSGAGQGVIVNEDGTINGPENPARRGSVVSIYGTGEGQTVPPGTDGLIVGATSLRRPLRTMTVLIGGQSAEVLYAGSAGNQVSGLFQANVRIPASLVPGSTVPVTITIDVSSQAGVTMALQ